MKCITTTIQRKYLERIISGLKTIEYRERKPYWDKRLEGIEIPFKMRLINGMHHPIPEVTVLINRVWRSSHEYHLYIGKILSVKHWNEKSKRPE